MQISSRIMALTMTAMLIAAPALAQNYSSGTTTTGTSGSTLNTNNTGASMNSGSSLNNNGLNNNGTPMNTSSKVNTGSNVNTMGTNRVRSSVGKTGSISSKLTSLSEEHKGGITRREFRKDGLSAKLFRKIDKNHNGIISKSELSRYENRNMGGMKRVKRY
jgi:hypothetical protein